MRKTVCMRRFGGHRAGEEGARRFFGNQKVTAEKIVANWGERTGEACRGRHVLALQDTTEVSFSTTAERRRGLGQCGHGNSYGVLAHVMLAVDAGSGAHADQRLHVDGALGNARPHRAVVDDRPIHDPGRAGR